MKTTNNSKVLDTMTRRSSAIRATLLKTERGYVVEYKIGSKRGTTEPMTRSAAATLWEGLQRVGC